MAKLPVACDLPLTLWFTRPVFAHGVLPLVLAFLLSCPAIAQGTATEKNVLIFRSFTAPSATADLVESQLRASLPGPINFYVEDLEGRRFDDQAYEASVVETVWHTYGGQKLDLIMAQYPPALDFALKYRDEAGHDLPIVFWEVDGRRLMGQKMWTGVTGVTNAVPVRGTIDLALHLHPGTNTVAIISDQSSVDTYWLAATHVGKIVEILGQRFIGTTEVSFNGTAAVFKVINGSFLKATVPAGATTGSVIVTTPIGTLTSNVPFRVRPQILSFTPTSGPVGTQVTITGVSLTQTTKVAFNGTQTTSFTVNSDTQVTATVPQGARGRGPIAITTSGGKTWSKQDFTVTQ